MPTVGAPRTFENKFDFQIEIDSVAHAGFMTCSELAWEIEQIKYREGGRRVPHKSPGLMDFEDITLERGAVAADSDLYDWMETVAKAHEDNGGEPNDEFKRQLDIVARDNNRAVIKRWRLGRVWPSRFSGGSWDANANEHTVESVKLCFESCRRITGGAGGAGFG